MQFKDLISICSGKVLQDFANHPVHALLTDSRKAVVSQGSVFFAIHGDRHDGHEFIGQLYQLGVRQFVVEKNIDPSRFPESNILQVESSLAALQAVAAHHRQQFRIPVVGITGSNGKTIVKEWLYQVLSPDLQVVKNPGSYNSQIGVPLSVWQMAHHNDIGIFEAGISNTGEMEKLQRIIKPTIGIFTNLGSAHDEGFSSPKEKAEEKAKLFRNCELVIYCKDHAIIDEVIGKRNKSLTWGVHPDADIAIAPMDHAHFRINYHDLEFILRLPVTDAASRQNAFHVIACMLVRNYEPSVIQERINGLRSVPMRLEIKQGMNHSILIDDTYNNDLAGLQISLDFLKNQQKTKKAVILSDILQSGLYENDLAARVKEMIESSGIKKFIGIGPRLTAASSLFPDGRFYKSTGDFLENFNGDLFSDEVILIKGARPFQFEKIIARLERKIHGTIMEIDLSAMVNNLNFFKSTLAPGTKVMAMVKAFAYGSGSEEVANLLQYHRVDYLGVAYTDEGIALRKNNISVRIMVMNPSAENFSSLIEYRLEPEMYSVSILKAFAGFLDGRPAIVHLKFDTGMHRLGIDEEDLDEALHILQSHPNITVGSIFSHLSGADEKEHDDFSVIQAGIFARMADQIDKQLEYHPLRHLLNSSGVLRLPQFQFGMVRLGIGLYGVDPTAETHPKLQPVATLKTVISQIKKIKAGDTIGYGRRGKAKSDMTLATLAIGYADGYSRSFSQGNGKFLIAGKLAPVVGNVCMDMTMVDVTGIQVSEGDEALVFGPGLPIRTVAGWINTIPYELLTSTSERVKRVFFAESI